MTPMQAMAGEAMLHHEPIMRIRLGILLEGVKEYSVNQS